MVLLIVWYDITAILLVDYWVVCSSTPQYHTVILVHYSSTEIY